VVCVCVNEPVPILRQPTSNKHNSSILDHVRSNQWIHIICELMIASLVALTHTLNCVCNYKQPC